MSVSGAPYSISRESDVSRNCAITAAGASAVGVGAAVAVDVASAVAVGVGVASAVGALSAVAVAVDVASAVAVAVGVASAVGALSAVAVAVDVVSAVGVVSAVAVAVDVASAVGALFAVAVAVDVFSAVGVGFPAGMVSTLTVGSADKAIPPPGYILALVRCDGRRGRTLALAQHARRERSQQHQRAQRHAQYSAQSVSVHKLPPEILCRLAAQQPNLSAHIILYTNPSPLVDCQTRRKTDQLRQLRLRQRLAPQKAMPAPGRRFRALKACASPASMGRFSPASSPRPPFGRPESRGRGRAGPPARRASPFARCGRRPAPVSDLPCARS